MYFSQLGATDHHDSLLNLGRSDEGPSVSALLHELMKFILEFRTEIAWDFGWFCWLVSGEHPEIVNGFTGASEALLEDGDYEVDSEGERRRKLDDL